MSTMEVEMEDTEKRLSEPGNNLQVSESKVFDEKVETEVEKSPLAAAVLGDVNEGKNGGEDLNKCRTEVNHQTELKSEDHINPKSEADKPIEGTDSGNINIKSENEELLNTVASDQEQTAPISQVERQIDVENEVVAQKSTNGGVEEKMSAENDVEDGDCQKNVEKRPNEDVAEKKPNEPGKVDMANTESMENSDAGDNLRENRQLPTELSANKDPQKHGAQSDEVQQGEDEEMEGAGKSLEDKTSKEKEQGAGAVLACSETDGSDKTVEIAGKNDGEESSLANQHITAKSSCLPAKAEDYSGEIANTFFTQSTLSLTGEGDDGTPEEQAAFMKELESFYREKAMDFKPPKFYGQPLNCLKLWMAVIRLGGYDKVTGSKLWRQVGESFHPPKTCTTVSWTFRIFYEKSLLEYERHKTQSGELQLPIVMLPNVSGADGEGNGYHGSGSGSGSGRARRDSAARAMQGWHAQRLSDSGEDKNLNNMAKHEKNVKSIVSLKQKRPNEVEHSNKAARIELSKQLSLGYKLVTSVVDIGPPADWVKINVRQLKDCFEVYALIPGLLREEVRVQSDPAGRVVITGQPEQVDNPWGITPFKKVVSLPGRIDPVQTSAVVSLHGRLLVHVPFEQQQPQPNL